MKVNDDTSEVLGRNFELSIDDAERLYNIGNFEKFSYSKIMSRAGQDLLLETVKTPVRLLGTVGQIPYAVETGAKFIRDRLPSSVKTDGNVIFGGETAVDIMGKAKSVGDTLMEVSSRTLDEINKQAEKVLPKLSPEEQESTFNTYAQVGTQLSALLGLSMMSPKAGLDYITALTLGGETEEGFETYKAKNKGSIEGYGEQAGKDLFANLANTAIQRKIEGLIGIPGKMKFFRSAKELGRAGLYAGATGWLEEGTQGLTDAIIDDFNGRLEGQVDKDGKPLTWWTKWLSQVQEINAAAVVQGVMGVGFALNNRASVKNEIKSIVEKHVEPEKVNEVVNTVYDSMDLSIKNVVAKELEMSSSLQTKRGEVYESLYKAALEQVKVAKEQGGFPELQTEEDIANYVKSVSDDFADETLAEAHRRNTVIEEVLDASTIRYENGRLVIGMTKVARDVLANQEKRLSDIKEIEKDLAILRGEKRGRKEKKEPVLIQQLRKIGMTKEFADRFDIRQLLGLQDEKFGASGLFRKSGGIHDETSFLNYMQSLGYIGDVSDTYEGEASRWDMAIKALDREATRILRGQVESDYDVYDAAGVNVQEDNAEQAKEKIDAYFVAEKQRRLEAEISSLSEDEQERFAMMTVAGGMSDEDALSEIKAARTEEEELPFPEFYQESLGIANQNAELDKVNPAYEGETININGVERTVYNSNGDRIAMSEPALRNFYKWFGNSKVVDEQGRPLVVYHGSHADFEEFSKEYIGKGRGKIWGDGFYFTNSREHAEVIATGFFGGREAYLYPVYLKIENPLVDGKMGYIPDEYDGRIQHGAGLNKQEHYYVVKEPNQVKATDNKGYYSESDNIYMQGEKGSIQFKGDRALITLTEEANSSTLAHELAHYWLQNTFLYSKSGLATPEYKQFFNSIAKYLDITDDQETIKEWQQEKWARAAEMYTMGKAPEGMEGPLTQYQQWIRKAYGEMSEPMYIDENGEAKVPEFDFETMKMFANLAGETLTEPEFKQKQEAVRGLAKSTNQMAQAKGMKTELPTYEKRSATDMGKKADEFIQRDRQLAIDIVKGLKPEQEGLFRQDLFAAFRELALNEGDSDLLNELSKSMTVEEATELGQRIQALARGRIDPVKQMVELRDERMKKNKVDKKKLKEETEKAKKEIKKEMAEASTPKEWADFIKSLEC